MKIRESLKKKGRHRGTLEHMEKIMRFFEKECGEENKWVIVGSKELSDKLGIGLQHSRMSAILRMMADEGLLIRELYGNKEILADTRPRYKLNK
jgi:hypothetical protein